MDVRDELLLVRSSTKRAPARSLHTAGRGPLLKLAYKQELVAYIKL